MIPGENLKFKHQRLEVPFRGYSSPGGDYSYMGCLNTKDQTVSIWDTATNTVAFTVTLASSKNFTSLFYRPIDKCVYVLGINWQDVIDLDPSSGTFGTVISSVANQIQTGVQANYLPPPLDAITPGRTTSYDFEILPVDKFTSTTYWLQTTRDKEARFGALPPRIGHTNQIVGSAYYPKNNMICAENQFYDIFRNQSRLKTDRRYIFRGNDIAAYTNGGTGTNGLAQGNVIPLLFKNFVLCNTGASVYVLRRDSMSNIFQTIGIGSGSNNKTLFAYDPSSRRVAVASKLSTTITIIELGFGQLTDLGDSSRSGVLASNETGTDDMVYNPSNKMLYLRGRRHGAAGETGVDRVYIYDLSQSLGSMYQSYITVGQGAGADRSAAYAPNVLFMTGNRSYESDHAI